MASRARFAPIGVLMCLIAVIAGMIMGACPAFACTAVYVGKDASADGTTIIAKSNDYQAVWPNYVEVTERVENEPGRAMPIDNGKTVLAPLPDTTYRYTSTPWMDSATATNGLAHDATVCANEYGVVMEMSITSFSNKAALAADPLIEHGLSESPPSTWPSARARPRARRWRCCAGSSTSTASTMSTRSASTPTRRCRWKM